MSGFIALHREAREHPLFAGNAERFGAWFWMVASACWKPTRFTIGGTTVMLERGQLCASRAQLSAAWGLSPSSVERFLTRLETEQMIGRETGQGRTIITICNYDKYQDVGDEAGQATGQATGQRADSHRTTKEQGNKGTIEEEAKASPSLGAGAGEAGEDLFDGDQPPAKPKPKRTSAAKRAIGEDTPLPDPFVPSLGSAAQRIVDGWPPGMLDRELFAFCSHAESTGRLAKNWNGAFGTWIAKSEERRITNGNRSSPARSGASYPQGRGAGQPVAAGFQRRAVAAQSRRAAEEAERWDAGPAGSDDGLPFAAPRALPRS
ncbi:hypothetical protein [Novosphingobium gossypii]|uniref:hypothetical protein n=1 Tax=Novosphingobium gossypii TaxID=1604774 RepID=UPI003D1EDBB3